MLIREVENPKWRDVFRGGGSSGKAVSPVFGDGLQFVGSGKGALALVLKYLRQKGILENKLSEVLVPDWIGSWVYNQIQEYAFPVKRLTNRTRVMLVYHQYGFPQDMSSIMEFARSNRLIVIEDCAHAIESYYQGQRLGTFGDFAIYSFSKWCFCLALGGVHGPDEEFQSFVKDQITRSSRVAGCFKDIVKAVDETVAGLSTPYGKDFLNTLTVMSYALYGRALNPGHLAMSMVKTKLSDELIKRKQHYRCFRENTDSFGICDHLEKEGVVPYVIPIRSTAPQLEKLAQSLAQLGVKTGIYQFDVRRNLLSPEFVPTLWIPCHSQLGMDQFNMLTQAVCSALS